MLTIWDLLAAGVIVAHDKEMGLIVLWNTNETLRMFRVREGLLTPNGPSYGEDFMGFMLQEIDVKTVDLSVNLSQNEKRALMVTRAEAWLQEDEA